MKHLLSSRSDLLEVRSADEWTPLLTAACLSNLDAIEAILAAGADPLVSDSLGRNTVHLFLWPPNGAVNDSKEKVKRLMDLFNAPARRHLLQQRCSEHPGGLTPLTRWLYGVGSVEIYRPDSDGALKGLLEYCEESDLDMVDNRGMTPLHLVNFPFPSISLIEPALITT